MSVVARLDEIGKPAWIGLTLASFIVFWPLGVVLLAYLLWSGRMGCWRHAGAGRWREGLQAGPGRWYRMQQSSGNTAFDEYREETLRRLEEEQREFKEFLDRLRQARDKTEFDQFMAERTRRTEGSQL